MFYGLRDENGKLVAIGESPLSPQWEPLDDSSQELKDFMSTHSEGQELQALAESDAQLIRVLDDVIELLIEKRVFLFTELPEAAQDKLLKRRWYRQQLRGRDEAAQLIDSEEGLL